MVQGPFATWDLIRKLSAAIPSLQKIKDHVESEINHFLCGKSHTSPDIEEDIQNLQAAYRRDSIHKYTLGRILNVKDKFKNYIAVGTEGVKLMGMISRWAANHFSEVATTEDNNNYDSD
jgi:hypothetical protein